MTAKDRNTPQKIKNEGTYTSDELGSYTLQDGTRVVEPPEGDIKRPLCAGIDVHKEILMAAICKTNPETLKSVFYVRQFKSTDIDIRNMTERLLSYGVKDVCMESTGKYWYPVYDCLEECGLKPILTHPKYVKQAKGRKTDFWDSIHIASVFWMNLVVASFIPPADIRDLREMCRTRLELTYHRTSDKNRYQNAMTVSIIQLDCVFLIHSRNLHLPS